MRTSYKVVSLDPEIRTRNGKRYQVGRAIDGSKFENEYINYSFECEANSVDVGDVVSAEFDVHNPTVIRDVFVEKGRTACAPAPPAPPEQVEAFDPNPVPLEPRADYVHMTETDIQDRFRTFESRLELLESKFIAHIQSAHRNQFGGGFSHKS